MSNDNKEARILGRSLTRELKPSEIDEVGGGAPASAEMMIGPPTRHTSDGNGDTWTDTSYDDYYC